MIQFCMKPQPNFGICQWQTSYLVQDYEELLKLHVSSHLQYLVYSLSYILKQLY
jgi:hypothetical protein